MSQIQQFADAVRKKIREDMNNYCDDMANGACPSYEAYQKLCGLIQGLGLAEAYILDLAKKAEQSDE